KSGRIPQSNHAVTLVGYKPDPQNPGKYLFKIKNSWGKTWGQAGYVWMEYGAYNFGETAAFVALSDNPQPDPGPGPDPEPGPQPEPEPQPQGGIALPQIVQAKPGEKIRLSAVPESG